MSKLGLRGYKTAIPSGEMRKDAPADVPYDRVVPTEWKLAVQRKLMDPTATWKQVAKDLGFTQQTVYIWTRNPEFQRYENWCITKELRDLPPEVRARRADARERLELGFETHAEEMQERLLAILATTDDEKLQASIAQDWLDRTPGGQSVRTTDKRSLQLVMTPELLEMFEIRRREAELPPAPKPVGSLSTSS